MKALLCIAVFVFLCGCAVGLVREYIFVNKPMNWTDAQQHCRQCCKDLCTITTDQENNMVIKAAGSSTPDSWIGLYRDSINAPNYKWSDGEESLYRKWHDHEPQYDCAQIKDDDWHSDNCGKNKPFYCERIWVLVKQNKTWEEALEYCRAQYTDLAFLAASTQLCAAKTETADAQTDRVWTGLRFLAGEWLWVSGDPLGSLVSLPSCPAPQYRCGTLNLKMNVLENRDCEENLNFLCN